jgi:hypothetical protein
MADRSERTTSEVAAQCGISVDLLRKYKARGFLKKAPPGVAGQGRGIQLMWSEEAFQEVKHFLAIPRPSGRNKSKASSVTPPEGK